MGSSRNCPVSTCPGLAGGQSEGVHQSKTRLGLCINVRAICRRPARWRRSFNPERSARRLGAYVRTSSCMSTPSRPKLHQLSNSAHVLVLVGSLGAHGQICSGGLRGRLCGWVQTGCGANPLPSTRMSLLTGQVVLNPPAADLGGRVVRPVAGPRLRSGRHLRLPTLREKQADSDNEDEQPHYDTLAPRLTRRGVPRRSQNCGELAREAAPISKKAISPQRASHPPRMAPLSLIRSGASDLLACMELKSPQVLGAVTRSTEQVVSKDPPSPTPHQPALVFSPAPADSPPIASTHTNLPLSPRADAAALHSGSPVALRKDATRATRLSHEDETKTQSPGSSVVHSPQHSSPPCSPGMLKRADLAHCR